MIDVSLARIAVIGALLLLVAGPIIYFWYGMCAKKLYEKKLEFVGRLCKAISETMDEVKNKIPNFHKPEDTSR